MEKEKTDSQYALDIISGSNDRDKERLIKVIVALIVAWALTIGGFLLYLNQYDFTGVNTEISQDADGLNIVGSRNGAYVYGPTSQSDDALPDA